MDEKELWERISYVESSVKSAHHRINSIEKLTQSVSDMVVEVRHMREDVNMVRSEIEELKKRPSRMFDKLVGAAAGAAASGLTAILISRIFG